MAEEHSLMYVIEHVQIHARHEPVRNIEENILRCKQSFRINF